MSHEQTAARDRTQLASVNNGHPGTPAMDSVNGRRFNQQGRIANGVASGRLNAAETGRADRKPNGGTPAPQQKQQVARQQNNMSNAANAHPKPQAKPAAGPKNEERR
jgi:hypothetical protein